MPLPGSWLESLGEAGITGGGRNNCTPSSRSSPGHPHQPVHCPTAQTKGKSSATKTLEGEDFLHLLDPDQDPLDTFNCSALSPASPLALQTLSPPRSLGSTFINACHGAELEFAMILARHRAGHSVFSKERVAGIIPGPNYVTAISNLCLGHKCNEPQQKRGIRLGSVSPSPPSRARKHCRSIPSAGPVFTAFNLITFRSFLQFPKVFLHNNPSLQKPLTLHLGHGYQDWCEDNDAMAPLHFRCSATRQNWVWDSGLQG